jgi:hypothetical protein
VNDAGRTCVARCHYLLTIPRSEPYYVTKAALEARSIGEQMQRRVAKKALARLTQRRSTSQAKVANLLTYTARSVSKRGRAGRAIAHPMVEIEAAAA